MTHIEQLIKDLCPHGVEWKTMGEVCTINRGVRVIKSELETQGLYPVYQNSLTPLGYYKKSNYPANTTFIISAGAAGKIGYSDVDFWAADDCLCIICPGSLLSKFLYYCMTNKQDYFLSQVRHASVPRMSRNVVENFEIPLPPLEIQEKIVECLDKFSTLAAELAAELQMRRKQYEYYRTQLLTPHSDCNSATNTDDRNWEWKTLGELCNVYTGGETPKDAIKDKEPQGEYIYPIYSNGVEENALYGFARNYVIEQRAVTFSSIGTIGHPTLREGKFTPIIRLKVIIPKDESKLNISFLKYALDIAKFSNNKSSVPNINANMLKQIQIPIPPLAEQARIVAILDKFEALTTSLSDGIPAEQAAQQKRYEYYRDLLLTFDRKTV